MIGDLENDEYNMVMDGEFESEATIEKTHEEVKAMEAGSPGQIYAIRRAIEARHEARELQAAINYLEFDGDYDE